MTKHHDHGHDHEKERLENLLAEYNEEMRSSDPPPPNSLPKLVKMLVAKIENLEKSRQSIGDVLGVRVHDSGTFEPVDQTTVDLMFCRQEQTRLREELAAARKTAEKWSNKKEDWILRILGVVVAAVAGYYWHKYTGQSLPVGGP